MRGSYIRGLGAANSIGHWLALTCHEVIARCTVRERNALLVPCDLNKLQKDDAVAFACPTYGQLHWTENEGKFWGFQRTNGSAIISGASLAECMAIS